MFEKLKLVDRELFLFINGLHAPLLDTVMYYVSAMWVFMPVFIYWFYLAYKKYHFKKVMILIGFLIFLVALTDQTANRIKHGVKRYRPTHNTEIMTQVHILDEYRGGQYGFISGHATNSFGIAMLLFLLFSKRSILFRISFFLWAALTAYSRIYLGVHYPSDIFVGAIVGIFWGFIVYRLIQYTFLKQFNETISI